MKKMYYKVLSIGVILFALWSCSGNNDANQQQQVAVPAQEAQVQAAPVDSTAQAPADPRTDAAQGLPGAITSFLKQHFPNSSIVGAETDLEHGGVEYDVYLSDGTQVDFDANNKWEKVESMKGVPDFFVPDAISSYVKGNYQNIAITKINKEYHGYDVELANGLDLSFDRSGRFLGMDD